MSSQFPLSPNHPDSTELSDSPLAGVGRWSHGPLSDSDGLTPAAARRAATFKRTFSLNAAERREADQLKGRRSARERFHFLHRQLVLDKTGQAQEQYTESEVSAVSTNFVDCCKKVRQSLTSLATHVALTSPSYTQVSSFTSDIPQLTQLVSELNEAHRSLRLMLSSEVPVDSVGGTGICGLIEELDVPLDVIKCIGMCSWTATASPTHPLPPGLSEIVSQSFALLTDWIWCVASIAGEGGHAAKQVSKFTTFLVVLLQTPSPSTSLTSINSSPPSSPPCSGSTTSATPKRSIDWRE
eukprot:GHVN01041825.1.p1 GENE.GHVN01041825.1~~GHVN01041825.1.p1  ORF type:complete len:297 (+),score=82.22 GHVN01041825.1:263-1153(+)